MSTKAEKPLPPMAQLLEKFWQWLKEGKCLIKPAAGKMIPLRPNRAQRNLFAKMYRQACAGKPIRVIILKARRVGISTFIQALNYFVSKHCPHMAAETIAHSADSTAAIFAITRRILNNDREPAEQVPTERRGIAFKHDSTFITQTAGGHYVGSGDAVDFLHISELAKWHGSGNSTVETMLSALNVLDDPNTMIAIESTANASDESGEFERRYRAASNGEDYAGDFETFFVGWHEDERYRIDGMTWERLGPLDEYEQAVLVEKCKCDAPQIAWYRRKLWDGCAGNRTWMGQEYPSTPDEAFRTAVGKVYPGLSEERNVLIDMPNVEARTLHRAIDFGGSDPFVCLWIAHTQGPPGLTIDTKACPNTWREMTTYHRDDKGKPADKDNHTCDALRYACVTFKLTGHVHVYRELYMENFAHKSKSELDCAREVLKMGGHESYAGSVADRSRPSSISLFNQQGVYCTPHRKPKTTVRGEIEDGIAWVTDLLIRSVPMQYDPLPEPLFARLINHQRSSPIEYVIADTALRFGMADYATSESGNLHPWFGSCN